MKKTLLLIFILFFEITRAQIVSITPDHAQKGQSLTTTITAASGVISMSSGPMGLNDIYLKKGNYVIQATYWSFIPPAPPHSDDLSVDFSIPVNAPTGQYDVHLVTYVLFPFPVPTDNVLYNGFGIGDALIEGEVYFDANQNGARDTNEYGVANRNILLNPGNTSASTDVNGHYKARADSGTYAVNCNVSAPLMVSSIPSVYMLTVPPDSSGNDFGVYAPPAITMSQDFSSYAYPFRCNRPEHSGWTVSSSSNNVQHGVITLVYSNSLSFVSSTLVPTSHTGNVVKWDYNLQPYATIYSELTLAAPGFGNNVWMTITDSLFDLSGNFVSVSIDSYNETVRCSHDPNDKHVSPEGVDSLHHYTLKSDELTYTIRFQNCGNDTAFNINILDTLDSNLDLSTFHVLSSSDPVNAQLDSNGIVNFHFDNIMLPDSNVDELNSHGYVIYRISPKTTVTDSTVIENTAYIYFDFNPAVVTNTAFNTLVSQLPTGISQVRHIKNCYVYPNPVTGNSTLVLPSSSEFDLHIYDSTGRELVNKTISENYLIQKNKFTSGVYYYQLNAEGKNVGKGKFVIVE